MLDTSPSDLPQPPNKKKKKQNNRYNLWLNSCIYIQNDSDSKHTLCLLQMLRNMLFY